MCIFKGFRRIAGALLLFVSTAASAVSLSPVTILQVDPATDGSGSLLVHGRVDTAAGVASMNINDVPVSAFDGEFFDAVVTPATAYTINLAKFDGTTEQIQYSDPSAKVDTAIQVLIGNPFVGELGDAMGRLLANLDINAILGISPGECVVNTWYLIGCDFYIDRLGLEGTPDIDIWFTPGNGEELTINLDIKIPKTVVSTRVKRSYWFGYDRSTFVTRDIRVFVQLGAKATANQSVKLILDDPSDINIRIGSMQVYSINLAAHLVPVFSDAIINIVNRHLVALAGPLLNALPIPAIPIALPLDINGDGNNDAEFAIKMGAELLDVLSSGEGQAVLAGSISSKTVAPGRDVLGSRTIPSVAPNASALTGNTDVAAAVSVNLVNQILTAVYQSGIEEKIVLPVTFGDVGLLTQLGNQVGYGPEDPLNISLQFGAQPELQVNSTSLYPLGLEMVLPAMRLVMAVPKADGSEEVIVDLTSDFGVDTSLGTDGDGKLFLEFQGLLGMTNVAINGGTLTDVVPPNILMASISLGVELAVWEFYPMINDLLNSARLELDIGQVLSDWLNTEFPSVPMAGYVSDAGVSSDESYLEVGIGIDFE